MTLFIFVLFVENPEWLKGFAGACHCWDGVNLSRIGNMKRRQVIEDGKATLLDMRNYLFYRQCSLLFSLNRPHEVAHKAQDFMHEVVKEIGILEV